MKASSSLYVGVFLATGAAAQGAAWSQCGGNGWSGATTCVAGYVCTYVNAYYSQCIPGTATLTTSTSKTTSTSASSTSSGSSPTSSSTLTQYIGTNIAGFDFGCTTDGTCNVTAAYPALASTGGPDGIAQMKHFVSVDHHNVFRLPVGWQYLVNNVLGGTLDSTKFGTYDQLLQGCLATGASCIIDIHNYARWNGGIIGQGGPTDAQFASLWSQLAAKYKGNSKVIFGLMNEPHDVPSITTWAASVQAAVTAIRQAGATSNTILLPGNDWTSAGSFISDGSAAALSTVKNLDGTTTNLVFDVHKYLDSDNSGTHTECVTNNIDTAFAPLATWLRTNKRQAFLSETGGGVVQSCITYLCQEFDYLNANSDVYIGYTGWSAGSFAASYMLSETPTGSGSSLTDNALVSACLKR